MAKNMQMLRKGSMLRSILVAAMVALALCLVPKTALARDYSITQVDIEATLDENGTLSVKEVREFDFDGSFHGVYWKIPTGTYQGRSITTSILSVGEVIDGQYVAFQESTSGSDHTYELSEYSSYVQVKLYSAHEDEKAQFAIVYADENLGTRYDDTGELYWKFVSDGWDVESQNVTCTIHLPVPGGQEVIPAENVRAWGHGPLDATVSFSNGDVIFQAPGVGSSEFAEARITFPADWLSNVETVGYSQLDSILAEEQKNADEANARRHQARIIMGCASAVGIAVPVGSLAALAILYRRYKVSHKPIFNDKYFRDVPSDDHPAVLGALYNGGTVTDECLTASVMRLTDQGMAKLELVKFRDTGLFGREKTKEDFCLSPTRWPEKPEYGASNDKALDYATMRLLFSHLVPLEARITKNADVLYFGSLEKTAKEYPERYTDYYDEWKNAVETECDNRMFFVDEVETHEGLVAGLGILNLIMAFAAFIGLMFLGANFWLMIGIPALCGVAGALLLGVAMSAFDDMSRETIELRAKLKALRRWLKDFTRLDEAIPQDVVLWNKLLVMAVVLGVADEVIEQLRTVMPEMLRSSDMAPVYGWYYYGGHSMPSRAFSEATSAAHSVSTAALAESSSSSGGGGGGGFSGGGGGGFGGGGGGGAF